MREILFRGKRKDNGKWTSGLLFLTWEKAYICWGITNGVPNMEEVISETVGQHTGRTTTETLIRIKKWIFEGDIVCCVVNNHYYVGVVYWHDCSFHLDCTRLKGYCANYELDYICDASTEVSVIGNIYDNPELLEGGKT